MNTAWFNAGRALGYLLLSPLFAFLAVRRWLFPTKTSIEPDKYLDSPPFSRALHVCPIAGPWHSTKGEACWCQPYNYLRNDGTTVVVHGVPRA